MMKHYNGREFNVRVETKEEKTCWMNAIALICVGKLDSARAYARKLQSMKNPAPPPQPPKPTIQLCTAEVSEEPTNARPPPPIPPKPAARLCTAEVHNEPSNARPPPPIPPKPAARLCTAEVHNEPSHTRPPPLPPSQARQNPPSQPKPPPRVSSQPKLSPRELSQSKPLPQPTQQRQQPQQQSQQIPRVPSYLKQRTAAKTSEEEPTKQSQTAPPPASQPAKPSYLANKGGSQPQPPPPSRQTQQPRPPPSRPSQPARPPPMRQQQQPTRPQGAPPRQQQMQQGPVARKTLEQTRFQAKGQHHAVPDYPSAPPSSSVVNAAQTTGVDSRSHGNYDICFVCQGAIVMARDCVYVDKVKPAHEGCFKCTACAKQLDAESGEYGEFDGWYYCLAHLEWAKSEAARMQEAQDKDIGPQTPARPGIGAKWKLDWNTKRWNTE